MQKQFAMELADALESGKFKQTKNVLASFKGGGSKVDCEFCCLGVACMLSGIKRTRTYATTLAKELGGIYTFGNSSTTYLPSSIMKKYGFYDEFGGRRDGGRIKIGDNSYVHLASANDAGVSFKQIAAYIRANYKDL